MLSVYHIKAYGTDLPRIPEETWGFFYPEISVDGFYVGLFSNVKSLTKCQYRQRLYRFCIQLLQQKYD